MLIPEDQLWMVIVGFIIAFVLAFGIGANDVANTFGSSVGSGVLTLKQACTLATICELLGALLLGSRVSSTIRKGIVDTSLFDTVDNGTEKLMAGQVAALGGSCSWLLVATFFRLPVSGTHSIVGATVGFSLVLFGVRAIRWAGLGKVVASWFLSPVLSGLLSVGIFAIIQALVLAKEESLERAVNVLPGFYGFMVVINLITILIDGSEVFQFNKVPIYGMFIISFGCGTITVICIKFIFVPYLRRRILAGENAGPGLGARLSRKLGFMKLSHLYQSLRRKKKHKSCATNERTSPQTLDQTISTLRHSADHNWDGRKMHSLELHENIGTNSNANGIAVQMVHCQHPFDDNGWQQRPRSEQSIRMLNKNFPFTYCFSQNYSSNGALRFLSEGSVLTSFGKDSGYSVTTELVNCTFPV
ncbi:unnamed protein product [Dicrocoelium dendriticum]|nr:unnamed protein product [Dicrocoelium dendriticum]